MFGKEYLWAKAMRSCNSGKWREAVKDLDEYLSFDPNNAVALTNKGVALFELGNIPEAYECTKKAYSIAPNYPPTLNLLGNIAIELGDCKTAIDWFDAGINSINRTTFNDPATEFEAQMYLKTLSENKARANKTMNSSSNSLFSKSNQNLGGL